MMLTFPSNVTLKYCNPVNGILDAGQQGVRASTTNSGEIGSYSSIGSNVATRAGLCRRSSVGATCGLVTKAITSRNQDDDTGLSSMVANWTVFPFFSLMLMSINH